MRRNRSFWRNVALIGALHLALLLGLTRWGDRAQKRNRVNITWMDSAVAAAVPAAAAAETPSEPTVASTPDQTPTVAPTEETPEPTVAAPSDLSLETPTPQPSIAPTPRPKEASATPKPKPTPKATPKKKHSTKKSAAKQTPKSKLKKSAEKKESKKAKEPARKPTPNKSRAPKKDADEKSAEAGKGKGAGNRGSGTGNAAQASWYGNMLHDRFFRAWVQPTSVVSTGARMSVLIRVRIEADGRVSAFEIVRSSGNVVVDQSVEEIAQRVTRVDPLPTGGDPSGHYEVKINFQLGLAQ